MRFEDMLSADGGAPNNQQGNDNGKSKHEAIATDGSGAGGGAERAGVGRSTASRGSAPIYGPESRKFLQALGAGGGSALQPSEQADDPGKRPTSRQVRRRAYVVPGAKGFPGLILGGIDAGVLRNARVERGATPPRAYIGASSVGNECNAFLALTLRGFRDDLPDAKTQRIFALGHLLETVVVDLLRAAGVWVQAVDPATGKQWHYEAEGGHVQANLDGLISDGVNYTHTLEVKSMNLDLFKSFMARGVAVSHPHYLDQVQLGMGLSGIHKCVLVAYCKNNSELWAEEIDFDAARFASIGKRINHVMGGGAEREEGFGCTRCHKRTACKTGALLPSDRHCRHCKHAEPLVLGRNWYCTLHGFDATTPCSDFSVFRPTP
ncbi:hypothetical protein UFOVP708_53 [uncultured Caudovirales phage]|uniref:PD-(D/E)XK nuclease superfamily n=1 Tax=uncultured Caudovirales phage TaxID=2100421 RepID=A0A6J5NII1_9CAUD|nr:hypothetical protein UFOVP708_53 [uncultured Caudovirales phage]